MRRHLSRWGTVLALLALGGFLIYGGTLALRVQHSGIAAVVTVKNCYARRGNSWTKTNCSADWKSGSHASYDHMTIDFEDDSDIGHDVNVHISHSRLNPTAIPDDSLYPTLMFAGGCALAGIGVIYAGVIIVRGSRRRLGMAARR